MTLTVNGVVMPYIKSIKRVTFNTLSHDEEFEIINGELNEYSNDKIDTISITIPKVKTLYFLLIKECTISLVDYIYLTVHSDYYEMLAYAADYYDSESEGTAKFLQELKTHQGAEVKYWSVPIL